MLNFIVGSLLMGYLNCWCKVLKFDLSYDSGSPELSKKQCITHLSVIQKICSGILANTPYTPLPCKMPLTIFPGRDLLKCWQLVSRVSVCQSNAIHYVHTISLQNMQACTLHNGVNLRTLSTWKEMCMT